MTGPAQLLPAGFGTERLAASAPPHPSSRTAAQADLASTELHLHHIDLDVGATTLARQLSALSATERSRAAAFVHEQGRARFVAGRWSLRTLLGQYLNLSAAEVPLTQTPSGKPVLPHGDLRFNLSHSAHLALLAVTQGTEVDTGAGPVETLSVGTDLERMRAIPELSGMAAMMFTPREQMELAAAPPEARLETFYRLWTRREATLKALGTGLVGPAAQVEVSGTPVPGAKWLLRVDCAFPLHQCFAADIHVAAPFQAACVVLGGAGLTLKEFCFDGEEF